MLAQRLLTLCAVGLAAASLPRWAGDEYQLHLATLIASYWILVSGLNLVIGFAGQLSIGHVGLLSIGAYTFAILAGKAAVDPALAVLSSGAACGLAGLVLGLPSLRLPGFYFAMATMAISMIVGEFVLAQDGLTGGGIGLPVPGFSPPFDTREGFYWLVLGCALLTTLLSWNIARSMFGRGLIAIRDSVVAAQASGVPVLATKLAVFVFSGVTAGLSGAFFASLQSYITPDTFHFDLSMFFFVCIIIGGRGSLLGPFLGTAVLTALPELVAPLASLGNLFYGLLLLLVVLILPEGMGRVVSALGERLRPVRHVSTPVRPDLPRLASALRKQP
jgi:branched-chain amino acid transport system permease protein